MLDEALETIDQVIESGLTLDVSDSDTLPGLSLKIGG